MKKCCFISGKGGTGKSTISSLLAWQISEKYPVKLVSMDSAHSISTIFDVDEAKSPIKIKDNLTIFEPDTSILIEKTVNGAKREIKNRYRFLDAFNSSKIIDILSISPGIEDQSMWESVHGEIKDFEGIVIIDGPPTGQSEKLISMPVMMTKWSQHLNVLAQEISKLSEKISGSTISENRKIINSITSQNMEMWKYINDLLKSSVFFTTITSSPLTIKEVNIFHRKAKGLGYNIIKNIANFQLENQKTDEELYFNYFEEDLIGVDSIKNTVIANSSMLEKIENILFYSGGKT